MWEYTAQQEICGDNKDNDGDGLIDEGCTAIPVCHTDNLAEMHTAMCGAPIANQRRSRA